MPALAAPESDQQKSYRPNAQQYEHGFQHHESSSSIARKHARGRIPVIKPAHKL